MAVRIFLTGATGFIGGTAYDCLVEMHPEYEYTLLVRNEERAQPIKTKYPNTKFVYGTFDDADLVEKAATEADVVLHTGDSADSVAAANAIAKGLASGHSVEKPGYWIHTSGTGLLLWHDIVNKRAGEAPVPEEKYDDLKDIQRLLSFPDGAPHRNVDKMVQAANSDIVKTAIVCPPTIYGTGSGTLNTRSIQIPDMILNTLIHGYGPVVGNGLTEWDHVHVRDLGYLFVKLVEATQDPSLRNNQEVFGVNGYFFAESDHHKWADIAEWVVEDINKHGYLPDTLATRNVTMDEVKAMEGFAATSWGLNSRGTASRAREYLGWTPSQASVKDTITESVVTEAKARGLTERK